MTESPGQRGAEELLSRDTRVGGAGDLRGAGEPECALHWPLRIITGVAGRGAPCVLQAGPCTPLHLPSHDAHCLSLARVFLPHPPLGVGVAPSHVAGGEEGPCLRCHCWNPTSSGWQGASLVATPPSFTHAPQASHDHLLINQPSVSRPVSSVRCPMASTTSVCP